MHSNVYWIHHPEHTDMFTQGYIGVTNNTAKRFERHLNRTQNNHLSNAIKKYSWGTLVKQVVLKAGEAYCLDMETKMRPIANIGWNIAIGGGKPPAQVNSGSFKAGIVPFNKGLKMDKPAWNKGISCRAETKEKLRQALLGRTAWNKGIPSTPEQAAFLRTIGYKKGQTSPRNGVILSQDIRDKVSASKTGTKLTQEHKDKVSKAHLGRKQTLAVCPHCHKSGGSQTMPRWHFDNCKHKDKTL